MYLTITIPAALFNCFFVCLALRSIYQYFQYSEYKPRLVIITILILGRFPGSITNVLTCLINTNILSNPIICYGSATLSLFGSATPISLLMLTIYTLLILFSKFQKRKINIIGYIMVIIILLFLASIQLIILPYFGAKAIFPFAVNGKTFCRACSINNDKAMTIICNSFAAIALFVFSISLILLAYFLYSKNLKKGERKYKFFLVFSLFSVIEILYPFKLFFEGILGIQLNQTFKYILTDFLKMASGLYSLIYYLIEVYFRRKIEHLNIEAILKIDKTRRILKGFLEEKGYRSLWNMLLQWEQIYPEEDKGQYYTLAGYDHFLKEFALKYIEKELEKVLGELAWYDEFCDYYGKLAKLGGVEIDLMMQGKISRNK